MPDIDTALDAAVAVPVAEAKAAKTAAEAYAGELVTGVATIRTDFGTLWAHKAMVLFDVVLIGAGFVAGHYL